MTELPIRFDDGAAYERFMGVWSRQVGLAFLAWLDAPAGRHWLDVGCGNGAFTELVAARCAPGAIDGLDPSAAQLEFARGRPGLGHARFHQGDAMALPLPDASVDIAVMPLVLFFVPEPARGVAEMARVVRPGGLVTAYSWDMTGGGFPYAVMQQVLRELGHVVLTPPSMDASRMEVVTALWNEAGLADIATRAITVQRTWSGFDDYWSTVLGGPSIGATLATLSAAQVTTLKDTVRSRLPVAADGSITCSGTANAIRGRVRG